jgi:hypothetical protein
VKLIASTIFSVIAIIPIAGWAQQPALDSAQHMAPQVDKVPPAPGRYLGMIFNWPTTVTVASVDKEGQIHGSLTSCPNEMRRKYGLQCSTVEFNTRPGKDGLPEHIAPRPITNDSSATNDYSRIEACGGDLCTHVSRMIGREDGKGDEKVDVDIKLMKQAADAAPTAEQPPPAPMPIAPPTFTRPAMPAVPGMPPTLAVPPSLPPATPVAPTPQTVAPLSPK